MTDRPWLPLASTALSAAIDDQATFRALINSVTSNEEWSANCGAVLEMCALNIRQVGA